jgi:hypothetical protein
MAYTIIYIIFVNHDEPQNQGLIASPTGFLGLNSEQE